MKFFIPFTCFLLSSCGQINQLLGLPDDNFGEQIIEEILQDYSQIGVDLSPDKEDQ
jgi:hypothetical protein